MFNKRQFLLTLASLSAAILPATHAVAADKFPDHPIMFVVPFPPGGPTDAMARVLGAELTKVLGQTVVVENRAGAGGNIGADYVAHAKPDGYTILFGTSGPLAINQSLFKKLNYDPRTSFSPIMYVGYLPNVLIVLGVLIALYAFVTNRTVLGRRIYALGGNQKAAKLSGVNTERLTLYTFINMGVLAALAGLIITARLNSATAKAGTGFELDAIAATFIGGASATGGIGTVFGVVIGAFIMGTLNNGMSILGVGIDWQQAIKGTVLLIAVFFDVYNKNKS